LSHDEHAGTVVRFERADFFEKRDGDLPEWMAEVVRGGEKATENLHPFAKNDFVLCRTWNSSSAKMCGVASG